MLRTHMQITFWLGSSKDEGHAIAQDDNIVDVIQQHWTSKVTLFCSWLDLFVVAWLEMQIYNYLYVRPADARSE